MPCCHSKPAWRATFPDPETGAHALRFTFRDKKPDYFIPCGKCEGCRANQRRDWAVRIAHESQDWDRNCFVTITYNDEYCPESISRRDAQNFIKRLKRLSERPLRYYLVGEYGDKTRRPHYHAIIFNEDFLGGAYRINDQLYGNPHLDRCWGLGNVRVAEFSFSTALYTAGYVSKKTGDRDSFSLQSQRPPIGKNWMRKHHDNIRRNEKVVIDGKEMPIPQVYHNWVKGADTFSHLKANLEEKIKPYTDRQLAARKANYVAQNQLKRKEI